MQLWDKVRFYNINGHLWDIKSQLQKNTVVILFIFTPRQKKGFHTSILSPSNLPSRPPFPLHSLLAIYSTFYTSTAILLLQVTFRYLSISFTTFQIVAISTIYPIIGLLAYTHKYSQSTQSTGDNTLSNQSPACCRGGGDLLPGAVVDCFVEGLQLSEASRGLTLSLSGCGHPLYLSSVSLSCHGVQL